MWKVIKQFFHDILREEKGGKFSSKKAWGHVILLVVILAFICDGLHWYEMNIPAFNSMLIAGCSLIGLRTIKQILKRDTPTSSD